MSWNAVAIRFQPSSGNFCVLASDFRPHDDQLFGLLVGEGSKQRGGIDSENRGSSADTER